MPEISLLTEDDHADREALSRRYNEHFGTEISDQTPAPASGQPPDPTT